MSRPISGQMTAMSWVMHRIYPVAVFYFVPISFGVACNSLVVEVHLAWVLLDRRANSCLVFVRDMLVPRHTCAEQAPC